MEPSPIGTFSYKGCSDNVLYGIAKSSEFVDGAEKNKNQSQVYYFSIKKIKITFIILNKFIILYKNNNFFIFYFIIKI